MTSSENTKDSVEIITKSSEELTEKTGALIQSVAKTMGRRVEALNVLTNERGLSADPERLGRISESLFEAADTLIFLAEDVRSLQQQVARTNEHRNETGTLPGLSQDEQELFTMLSNQGGEPISMVALLEKGFGATHSDAMTARKKHLQHTIRELTASLTASQTTLVKIGKTRGTKYYLSSHASLSEEPEDETVLTVIEEPQNTPQAIATPLNVQPVPVIERPAQNPLEPIISDAIHRLLIDDTERPIICLADITREAFGPRILDDEVFQSVKQLIYQDGRLEQISNFEFHIKERSIETHWVDTQDIRERLHTFIDKMLQWDTTEESLKNLFKSVGRGRRFLTNQERTVLIEQLKEHHQFVRLEAGSFTINAAAEPNKSNNELRGMSPSEIQKQLNKLGITSRTQPFRRRR